MGKRTPALNPQQMAFSFDSPTPDVSEGALAELERKIASAVSQILRDDGRSRFEIAGQVSALMGEDVSKWMLDGYASEARDGHNISMARFLGLIVATQRFDALDAVLRQVGVSAMVGDEIRLAEIGHLEAQKRQLDQRLKSLKSEAQPLTRGRS